MYAFLEQKALLDTADDKSIQEGKKQYWAEYRRKWKKAKRQQNKSYTILLNDYENRVVVKEAKNHHTSPTNYIKRAALTIGRQIKDPVAVGELRELLYTHYNTLQTLVDEKVLTEEVGNRALEEITEIEKKTFALLSPLKQK
jgi:hypothetical protein